MDKRRFPGVKEYPLSSHESLKKKVVQLKFNNWYLSSVVYIVRCFHQILVILFTR